MKSILYIGLLLLILTSCQKKYYEYLIQNTAIRTATNFNRGSSFVYAIDGDTAATQQFDVYSAIHSGFYDFKNAAKNGPYYSYEILRYGIRSNSSDSISFSADGHSNADSGSISGYVSFVADTFGVHTFFMVIPFVTDSMQPIKDAEGTSAFAIAYYDSMEVNGKYYKQVYEMLNKQVPDSNNRISYLRTFYSVPDGLVKFEKKKGNGDWETRTLLRSNIVRYR